MEEISRFIRYIWIGGDWVKTVEALHDSFAYRLFSVSGNNFPLKFFILGKRNNVVSALSRAGMGRCGKGISADLNLFKFFIGSCLSVYRFHHCQATLNQS